MHECGSSVKGGLTCMITDKGGYAVLEVFVPLGSGLFLITLGSGLFLITLGCLISIHTHVFHAL